MSNSTDVEGPHRIKNESSPRHCNVKITLNGSERRNLNEGSQATVNFAWDMFIFIFFSFPHFEVDENKTLSEGGHLAVIVTHLGKVLAPTSESGPSKSRNNGLFWKMN